MEQYIKKLEDENKKLSEELKKYEDKFGPLNPPPITSVGYSDNSFNVANFSGNPLPLAGTRGMPINTNLQPNSFIACSPNGNMLTINDSGISVKANNITWDAQSVISTIESDAVKEIKELKKILEVSQRKPKPRFKRYCRFVLKKIKRKII